MNFTLLLSFDVKEQGLLDLYVTDGRTSNIKLIDITADKACDKVTELIKVYTELEEELK